MSNVTIDAREHMLCACLLLSSCVAPALTRHRSLSLFSVYRRPLPHNSGRLASVVAKQLLEGVSVNVVRCEDITLSGSLYRRKLEVRTGTAASLPRPRAECCGQTAPHIAARDEDYT